MYRANNGGAETSLNRIMMHENEIETYDDEPSTQILHCHKICHGITLEILIMHA